MKQNGSQMFWKYLTALVTGSPKATSVAPAAALILARPLCPLPKPIKIIWFKAKFCNFIDPEQRYSGLSKPNSTLTQQVLCVDSVMESSIADLQKDSHVHPILKHKLTSLASQTRWNEKHLVESWNPLSTDAEHWRAPGGMHQDDVAVRGSNGIGPLKVRKSDPKDSKGKELERIVV